MQVDDKLKHIGQFSRLLAKSFVVATLLLTGTSLYHARAVTVVQNETNTRSKKPVEFEYVCPMHSNVKSKSRGTCPKCNMTLVRKRVVKTAAS